MRIYLVFGTIMAVISFNADTSFQRVFDVMPGTVSLEFSNQNHFSQVQLVHDTVMGGQSDGTIQPVAEPAGLRFFGNLSLVNNGGFASAEFRLAKTLHNQPFNRIRLNVAADGRTYQLRLKTPYTPRGVAYVAEFNSAIDEKHYYFQPEAFRGQYRGRQVTNLPKLSFSDIRYISLMLADETSGNFSIILYSINFSSIQSI